MIGVQLEKRSLCKTTLSSWPMTPWPIVHLTTGRCAIGRPVEFVLVVNTARWMTALAPRLPVGGTGLRCAVE